MDYSEFVKYAVEFMKNKANSPWNAVGSSYDWGLPKTDCISYSIDVLSYAFKKTGNNKAAKEVRKLGKHGNELSAYLVKSEGWKGIYASRDFNHPYDGHFAYRDRNYVTKSSCDFWGVPIHYLAINYNPTKRPFTYHCKDIFEWCNKSYNNTNFVKGGCSKDKYIETRLNENAFKVLSSIEFGFGISKGASHTWLFSQGMVYEASSAGIPPFLFNEGSIKDFRYVTNAIVVPPFETEKLSKLARCRKSKKEGCK